MRPIRQWGNGGSRFLDVGCGTGLSSRAFAKRGFVVTACDVCQAMLDVAQTKSTSRDIRFVQADMRELPAQLGEFDVITWMDDVANHLLTVDDLCSALESSQCRLAPGGLLTFDVNSLVALREMSAGTVIVQRQDAFFIFIGETPAPEVGGVGRTRLTAFQRQVNRWVRADAVLEEKHFPHEVIERSLRECGLELLSATDLHHKIVYVARRA